MTLRHVLARHRAVVALLLALPLALAGSWSPAYGDTQPPSGPATVSADPLPTVQIEGVAWTQVIVGNTVYVGGKFNTARPAGAAAGTSTVPRSNFLAYDLTTGNLLPFAPAFDAQVNALAVSPDKKILYVGGLFTKVNGANRYRLVAFDLTKSPAVVLTSFTATMDASVYGLAATESKAVRGRPLLQRQQGRPYRCGGPRRPHRCRAAIQGDSGRRQDPPGGGIAGPVQGRARRHLHDLERFGKSGLRDGHGRRRPAGRRCCPPSQLDSSATAARVPPSPAWWPERMASTAPGSLSDEPPGTSRGPSRRTGTGT